MNKRQQDKTRESLKQQVSAASVFTRQPGLTESAQTLINNGITEGSFTGIVNEGKDATIPSRHNGVGPYSNAAPLNELGSDVRRGPKKKGDFKKVTLNLEVNLNTALDKYILSLKQQALENGSEAPNKSEWVRDLVENRLRDLGILP